MQLDDDHALTQLAV